MKVQKLKKNILINYKEFYRYRSKSFIILQGSNTFLYLNFFQNKFTTPNSFTLIKKVIKLLFSKPQVINIWFKIGSEGVH